MFESTPTKPAAWEAYAAPRRCNRGGRRMFAVLLATLTLSAGTPSTAGMPSSGLEGRGARVPDAAMAEMRGKYIRPDGVAYFGIQLQSTWESASGATAATMLISVDFNGQAGNLNAATPRVLVGWSGGCSGCSDPSVDLGPGGSLETVTGVVQSQQIAGSDNRVRNDMTIEIGPMDAGGLDETGLTEIGGSTSFAGGSVQFDFANNEIGLTLLGGDSEMVRQAINGDVGQMAQNVVLSSDFNDIRNTFTMTVGLDQFRQTEIASVQNAMSVMAGHGF